MKQKPYSHSLWIIMNIFWILRLILLVMEFYLWTKDFLSEDLSSFLLMEN